MTHESCRWRRDKQCKVKTCQQSLKAHDLFEVRRSNPTTELTRLSSEKQKTFEETDEEEEIMINIRETPEDEIKPEKTVERQEGMIEKLLIYFF